MGAGAALCQRRFTCNRLKIARDPPIIRRIFIFNTYATHLPWATPP